MIPRVVFCPNCHRKISVPKIAFQIKTKNGITIECGEKNCKGKVKIKSEQEKEVA